MIMKIMRKVLCFVVATALVIAWMPNTVEAVTKAKLNKKKVTLTITNSKKNPKTTLKVKGVSKKVAKKAKWSTSNKKVATVKKGKVTAKKAGRTTITCKVKGKKYTCKVTVKDKRTKNTGTLNVTITQKASETGLGPKFPLHPQSAFRDLVTEDDLARAGGADPYGVNKITVTYNGKDVTNEAEYEIDEPEVATVPSPGMIKATNYGIRFHLTVYYKDIKKTVEMRKTTVPYSYIVCYCGALFDDPNIRNKHADENRCAGCWIVKYVRYFDIRIKE